MLIGGYHGMSPSLVYGKQEFTQESLTLRKARKPLQTQENFQAPEELRRDQAQLPDEHE